MSIKILVGLLLAVFPIWMSTASQAVSFTSRGLDRSQVHLVVEVPHAYHERFYKRAQDHLNKAGLFTTSARTYSEWEPVLRLTLEVETLG